MSKWVDEGKKEGGPLGGMGRVGGMGGIGKMGKIDRGGTETRRRKENLQDGRIFSVFCFDFPAEPL
jgi:hypothetical protein